MLRNRQIIGLYLPALTCLLLFLGFSFLSCQKEFFCETCADSNQAPIAIAGEDQSITLPIDSTSLDGSASYDPDGDIIIWHWEKISGPDSFLISHRGAAKTSVRNLDTGTYRFQLTVTDNAGLISTDTLQVTVKHFFINNYPPVADAGSDQTIQLPLDSVILDGSGSYDPDKNMSGHRWKKISGPDSITLENSTSIITSARNLVAGVYNFELEVTDLEGLIDKDTVLIIVHPVSNGDKNIYIAGTTFNDNGSIAKFWQNGAVQILSNRAYAAYANSVFVADNNVFVAGNQYFSENGRSVATLWKNGVEQILSGDSKHGFASSVFVSGSDVYVAGIETNHTNGQQSAILWKNGVAQVLTGGLNPTARAVFVSGSDVYVVGHTWDGPLSPGIDENINPDDSTLFSIAVLWKNGKAQKLSEGTTSAWAITVYVSGSDVYVAGGEYASTFPYQKVKLWKNGIPQDLPDGSNASGVFVSGTDVYVAGQKIESGQISASMLWKNGIPQVLSDRPGSDNASSVFVSGNNVYVTGSSNGYATLWINGVAQKLPNGHNSSGISVYVK